MNRAYLSLASREVSQRTDSDLLGSLSSSLPFAIEPAQTAAWQYQIRHLSELAVGLPDAHFLMEFLIPRMGRRADLIVLSQGIVFVVEYKVGAKTFDRHGLDQVYGYALDLKQFHETSHSLPIVPILVATEATSDRLQSLSWDSDRIAVPLCICPGSLVETTRKIGSASTFPRIDPLHWIAGRYRPTPTIVEVAQALYRGHSVEEISRSEAGEENLTRTAEYVFRAIERAKSERRKIICFITGVPGAGKSLAGLNIATARQRAHGDEHAVFLSGNGPLVDVLRAALAIDAVEQAKEASKSSTLAEETRRASAFIQNIHHFRDDALTSNSAPVERVAIFDEAQRAWNVDQTSSFMSRKRGLTGFSMSEPEFLLSVMDRHSDWCAIVCLVGSGQEINTGEAGIEEWLAALERSFTHWEAHLPEGFASRLSRTRASMADELHLKTSLRSYRAERLSEFVGHVIHGNADAARGISSDLKQYPLRITRDIQAAREWLRSKKRGQERIGLLASSNALRLKPHGVFVKAAIEPTKWFLSSADDIRSSDALEDAATEFDVQGLEIDWACVCWDANLRFESTGWKPYRFKGSEWQSVNDASRVQFVLNSYRVLLTRARQGLVVFVPPGDSQDKTRAPIYYDGVYEFLVNCGFSAV